MKYLCNPLSVPYRYQFNADPRLQGRIQVCREAADPSMICFEGRYYIFASMTLSVWVSDDLVHWESHRLPEELPLYDYAPDVRVRDGWVWLCASNNAKNCDRWRTRDILNGPYEKVEGTFPFWDPNLFVDDDGRVYFYWGCSSMTPIWGVELNPDTMQPVGEKRVLIEGHPLEIGYERVGEDNSILPASDEEVEKRYRAYLESRGITESQVPEHLRPMIRGMFANRPYIEGAWMDKHDGLYYLQYACPGTQYNTYSDGVYVGRGPLGPFTLAPNNPYSYKPGGFLPGAGHGSTMQDLKGNYWHTATMRISVNHDFERRVGIWPAGFDADGEMYCNQRYGDWPLAVSGENQDPWRNPDWMLLSAGKTAVASSWTEGHEPEKACEENVRTWWQAVTPERGEWLKLDLGDVYDVHAVQVNFADDVLDVPCPGEIRPGTQARYIEERDMRTQWKLEGSTDGENWFVVADKSGVDTDLAHDLTVLEQGRSMRYLRLSDMAVPYGVNPCVSGLRVFGLGQGEKPAVPVFEAERTGDLDMTVTVREQKNTVGYNILFGSGPDKLYHSYMVFSSGARRIGALIAGRNYAVRVDAFNENGITEGTCVMLREDGHEVS